MWHWLGVCGVSVAGEEGVGRSGDKTRGQICMITYQDAFGMIRAHPLLRPWGHENHWRIHAIQVPMEMTVVAGYDGPSRLIIVGIARTRSSCTLRSGRICSQAGGEGRGTATKAQHWIAISILQSVRIAILQLAMTAVQATSDDEDCDVMVISLETGLFHLRHVLICAPWTGSHWIYGLSEQIQFVRHGD